MTQAHGKTKLTRSGIVAVRRNGVTLPHLSILSGPASFSPGP